MPYDNPVYGGVAGKPQVQQPNYQLQWPESVDSPGLSLSQNTPRIEGVPQQPADMAPDAATAAEALAEEWASADGKDGEAKPGESKYRKSMDIAQLGLSGLGGILQGLGEAGPSEMAYNLPGAGSSAPGLTGVDGAFSGKQQMSPRQSLALALLGRG